MTPNQAIRYLDHIIFNAHNVSPTIHNLIITLYASPAFGDDDRPLLRFLSTVPRDIISGKPYYDLDYALRICKENKRIGPCVTLYAEMGLWENSVDLALEKGDLELAKVNADKAEEEDVRLRKKLWLKIAKYVVQDKKDIKSCVLRAFCLLNLLTSLRLQGHGIHQRHVLAQNRGYPPILP